MPKPTFHRDCGVLLHPSSLPGRYGIGDLGPEALRFLDLLQQMAQSLWQFLPLNPPDDTHSPYQARSAFANDVRLLSPEALWESGLLRREELANYPTSNGRRVDFELVRKAKLPLLNRAAERLCRASGERHERFRAYSDEQRHWLDDYALFMVLRGYFDGRPWSAWPASVRDREPTALAAVHKLFANELERVRALQFLFDEQWSTLRRAAAELGIRLVGDLPIFVAHDSADVWCHQDLFLLKPDGEPSVVAGVPPDYFSATGQRWGNPLYDWQAHREQGFSWWVLRMARVLETADIVRIDHFRGFAAYWEIPIWCPTAIEGRWVPGPGNAFFEALIAKLGDVPIIAEDLGLITDDVIALKQRFAFPGMRVLQFSFGGKREDLPDHYPEATVAYTGTHDNDTLLGWYRNQPTELDKAAEHAAERKRLRRFLGIDDENGSGESDEIRFVCMRGLFETHVAAVIVPLQDILGEGSEGRMNVPGLVSENNWAYRTAFDDLDDKLIRRMANLAQETKRGVSARRAALNRAEVADPADDSSKPALSPIRLYAKS